MKKILVALSILACFQIHAQEILINEVDADQVGSDTLEFVELVGASGTSLDGYFLVFFNGGDANNASYRTIDLSGQVIPSSGFFVVGSAYVTNVNLNFDVDNNAIQNGADAIALYQGNVADYPNGTAPSLTGLVDALVYGTADPDDLELMALFGPGQLQVNEGAANNTESMSRVPDGGLANTFSLFVAQAPTPGATNGGTVGVKESLNSSWMCKQMMQDRFLISTDNELGTVRVWTLSGSLIQQYAPSQSQSMILDLSDHPCGMYMISSDNQSQTLKIVK